jgi:hypothetical protein
MAYGGKAIGSASNNAIQLTRAKRSATAQKKHALQKTCLSGRIGPGYQRQLGIKP